MRVAPTDSGRGYDGWMTKMATRLAKWLVREQGQAGHLMWVGPDAQVVDLGEYTPDELATIVWAWRVAYRSTQSRADKSTLAGARSAASRMGAGVGRLPRAEGSRVTRK